MFSQTHTYKRNSFFTGSVRPYTYDIQGNVYKLISDYPNGVIGDKTVEYDYDLQSGKVNSVTYQRGAPDMFMHRYGYDASNRLTRVETSSNGLTWETDAEYFYYRHGPLARTELGADKVQGLDYLYTLQGWIKGVNGTTITPETDMGQDGIINPQAQSGSTTPPQHITTSGVTYPVYAITQLFGATYNGPGYGTMNNAVARDAFGYTLDYFKNDYTAVSGNACLSALQPTIGTINYLYNGNIARMYTQIQNIGNNGYNYTYDQLNRLKDAQAWSLLATGNLALFHGDAYGVHLNYDADGNILKLRRNATPGSPEMDSLRYFYYTQSGSIYNPAAGIPANATNRLNYVHDAVSATAYNDDIDSQNSGNYGYDKIGNLVKDVSEKIDKIKWNNYGKVSEIIRGAGSSKPNIKFSYNPMGERIEKKVIFVNDTLKNYTDYYMRDAQGNIMAIYCKDTASNNKQELRLQELPIYGSSRLGVLNRNTLIATVPITGIGGSATNGTVVDYTGVTGAATGIITHSTNLYSNIIYHGSAAMTPTNLAQHQNTGTYYTITRGYKQYELANHLGNVLATVSDRKIPHETTPGIIDYYTADIVSAQDFYPFGMEMPGRKFNPDKYKFGFNGKLKDDEVYGEGNWYDYGMRPYDSRTGRPPCPDPLTKKYPELSPYQFFSDNPVMNIDIDGLEGSASTSPSQDIKNDKTGLPSGNTTAIDNATTNTAPVQDINTVMNQDKQSSQLQLQQQAQQTQSTLKSPEIPADVQMAKSIGEGVAVGLEAELTGYGIGLGLKAIGKISVPLYRTFGGEARALGKYYTPINPELYGSKFAKLAGLPAENSGAFTIKAKTTLSNLDFGSFGSAKPIGVNTGRWVPEIKVLNADAVKIVNFKVNQFTNTTYTPILPVKF